MLAPLLKFFLRAPRRCLAIALLCCGGLCCFIPQLRLDASANSLIMEGDKDLAALRQLAKSYANTSFLLLAYEPAGGDALSPRAISVLSQLGEELAGVEGVARVLSPANAPLLKSLDLATVLGGKGPQAPPKNEANKTGANSTPLLSSLPSITTPGIDPAAARTELRTSPLYAGNIISADGSVAGMLIFLSRENGRASPLAQIERIIDKYEGGSPAGSGAGDKFQLSGTSKIAQDLIDYIRKDLATYALALVILLGGVLFYFFRCARFVLLPLFICAAVLGSASGLFALLGLRISVISSNYLALLLIITLAGLIHLITHFIELAQRFPRAAPARLALATLLAKFRPSLYAVATTMISFISLLLSQIRPIIDLGVMMSLGLAISWLLGYWLLGCCLALLPRRLYRQAKFDLRLLRGVALFSLNHKRLILAVAGLAVILAIWGITKLRVENSFVNYFKDSSELKQGLLLIDRKLGGTLPLDVVVSFAPPSGVSQEGEAPPKKEEEFADFEDEFAELARQDKYFFTAQKIRIARQVHDFLARHEFIGSVLSLNSLLEVGRELNGGRELGDFELAFIAQNLPPAIKSLLLDPYVSVERNELRFIVRIIDSDPALRRDEFLRGLQKELDGLLGSATDKNEALAATGAASPTPQARLAGIMVLYNNMLQSLFASQFDTLAFVVLVIFGLFLLIFRSLRLAIIAILVNLIPLGLVFALMGILNLPLDLMSITIAAIAIGLGVDDAIHYIYRFRYELRRGAGQVGAGQVGSSQAALRLAIIASHESIGAALYYTSVAVVLGFGVMMSSEFLPTIYFGLLSALVMILLLCGSLFLLPCLLSSDRSRP